MRTIALSGEDSLYRWGLIPTKKRKASTFARHAEGCFLIVPLARHVFRTSRNQTFEEVWDSQDESSCLAFKS
jgi:hypothetical protein